MSAPNKAAQSSSDLPVRQGALSAEEIRAECPQFRILIIGKANAGKTTILRKVCNVKLDVKPIIYDADGKEVRQEVPTKVWLGNFTVLAKLTINQQSRLFSLSKILRRNKEHSADVLNSATDVLNPSTEVKQIKTFP
jgi:GTPase SAR1 family protein